MASTTQQARWRAGSSSTQTTAYFEDDELRLLDGIAGWLEDQGFDASRNAALRLLIQEQMERPTIPRSAETEALPRPDCAQRWKRRRRRPRLPVARLHAPERAPAAAATPTLPFPLVDPPRVDRTPVTSAPVGAPPLPPEPVVPAPAPSSSSVRRPPEPLIEPTPAPTKATSSPSRKESPPLPPLKRLPKIRDRLPSLERDYGAMVRRSVEPLSDLQLELVMEHLKIESPSRADSVAILLQKAEGWWAPQFAVRLTEAIRVVRKRGSRRDGSDSS